MSTPRKPSTRTDDKCRPYILTLQSHIRSRVMRDIDFCNTLLSETIRNYESIPLLQNLQNFKILLQTYRSILSNFLDEFNAILRRSTDLKLFAREYDWSVLSALKKTLLELIDQMDVYLSTYVTATDAEIIDEIRVDLHRRSDVEFKSIDRRFDRIVEMLTDAPQNQQVEQKVAYYLGLRNAYLVEIENLIQNVHDQTSITNVKKLIQCNGNDLRNELDKIEKLAGGEELEISFVLSGLSDDDDDDEDVS